MKRGRVWPAADDVRVAPVIRIAPLEGVEHFGINFILKLCAVCYRLRALVRFYADVNRVLEKLHFDGRLAKPHLREDGPGIAKVKACRGPRPLLCERLLLPVLAA